MTKHSKLVSELISSVLSEYIFEEENPFAAAADKEAAGDKASAEEAPADADADAEKEEAPKKKEGGDEDALAFNFDITGVKKYNTAQFLNGRAVAKKITKDGILATVQPDGVDILVGFDDITESAKKFFKSKK
jgi:hypothetical protein